jgi:hypothetical protein
MRLLLVAAVACSAALAFCRFSSAADENKSDQQTVSGILIDKACGSKQMKKDNPETAAADHDKACAVKCGKNGGFAVISGNKMWLLDSKGNKMAQAYFAKHDSTKVTVKGTEKGDTLAVASIDEKSEK